MKKRLLSLALSLALCAGLTVPVSAAKVPHIITWLDEDFESAGLLALSEGTFPVHRKGEYYKCGFVDETGKIIVPLIYNSVGYFSEGLAPVQTGKDNWYKWGYVDKTGKMVIPTIYENAFQFSEGVAPVEVEDGDDYYWEYIDKTGKTAIPGRFSSASSFYNGVASVVKDGKANYIDHNGNLLYKSGYQYMSLPSEDGMFISIIGGQWWLMSLDETVNILLDRTGIKYQTITGFSRYVDLAMFSYGIGTQWGWMNKSGGIVIPGIYTDTRGFGPNGLAAVARGKDGWGFINEKGETVIPFGFKGTGAVFIDGLVNAAIETDSGVKWGFIDTTGQMVIPAVYDKIYGDGESNYFIVVQDGRYGFMELVDEDAIPNNKPIEGSNSNPEKGGSSVDAVLSPQKLVVDGKDIECEKYNIGGSNYFKLRDLAYLLNGTGSQFGVGYDAATSAVTITTGQAYAPAGGELVTDVDNSATAQPSSQAILIDGVKHDKLTVYNIGGSNFFQLRELGNVLGFEVGYDQDTNTAIVRSTQK